MSEPERTKTREQLANEVNEIVDFLIPHVEEAMERFPPSDGNAATGAATFIHAFHLLGLSLATQCKVHPLDYVGALRMIAKDLEMGVVATVSQMAQQAKQRGQEAPTEASKVQVDF